MTVTRTSNGNWKDELENMSFRQSFIDMAWDQSLNTLFNTTLITEGVEPQMLHAAEEAGEYNKACIRMVSRPWAAQENVDRLVDETADLRIMLAQMEVILNEVGPADWPEKVQDRIREKAHRLRNRILMAHGIPEVGE